MAGIVIKPQLWGKCLGLNSGLPFKHALSKHSKNRRRIPYVPCLVCTFPAHRLGVFSEMHVSKLVQSLQIPGFTLT